MPVQGALTFVPKSGPRRSKSRRFKVRPRHQRVVRDAFNELCLGDRAYGRRV